MIKTRKYRTKTLAIIPDIFAGYTAKDIVRRHGTPLSTVYYVAKQHDVRLPEGDNRRKNMLRLHSKPGFTAKISASMKKKHQDPKFRKKISAGRQNFLRNRYASKKFSKSILIVGVTS